MATASSTTPLKKLFQIPEDQYAWKGLPLYLRDLYNYMMGIVVKKEQGNINNPSKFRFYDTQVCLALNSFVNNSKEYDGNSYCEELKEENNLNNGPCYPQFKYSRKIFENSINLNTSLELGSKLSMGAVIWLYYYEKMGIFKILGALMDDYNYKGKYTIKNNADYAVLIEHVSVLYRMGIASNLRDRVCLYEKSTGQLFENSFGMSVTRNEGFMNTFDNILKQALEHYSYRRLDNAIGSATAAARSSVATLTTIKDSLDNLKNQFQAFYFGRNCINTFLGIATVYATICLVRLLKSEIGISVQYSTPQDFIPAAYDILVKGTPAVNTDSNRFITYDNCATYGYRLLTDFEFVDTTLFTPSGSTDDPLYLWLNDIEALVEGYKNAVKGIKD